MQQPLTNETNRIQSYSDGGDNDGLPLAHLSHPDDIDMDANCDQVFRTAVIGILMVWALIALIAGLTDPASRPF